MESAKGLLYVYHQNQKQQSKQHQISESGHVCLHFRQVCLHFGQVCLHFGQVCLHFGQVCLHFSSEDEAVVFEAGDETTPPVEEKSQEIIFEPPLVTSPYSAASKTSAEDGGGIHIHVQQKALQTLFEKIPWEDLMDSFNNKLTHKQEIR